MKFCHLIIAIIIFSGLCGCVSVDKYYILNKDYLKRRQIESRRYEAKSEDLILRSSLYVLQDLGFNLKNSDYKLGYIYAMKDRDADNLKVNQTLDDIHQFLEFIIAIFSLFGASGVNNTVSNEPPTYDVSQQIFVVLVTSKSRTNKGFNVRARFARIVCNNKGACRYEQIKDNDIYQEFFDKLGQSLFLTVHDI